MLAGELVEAIELVLFTQGRSSQAGSAGHPNQSSAETRELLEQLVALSDLLHLTAYDVDADPAAATRFNVTAVPTVIIRRRDPATVMLRSDGPVAGSGQHVPGIAGERNTNVRFIGLPGGYEFSSLLAAIVDLSSGRTDLSAHARDVVGAIERPMHIQVFVTPSCPYCPRAVRMAHQLAMHNPQIVAEAIEANEFQELSERYRVRSVPKTVIDDRIEFVGSLPEAKVLEALQEAVSRHA